MSLSHRSKTKLRTVSILSAFGAAVTLLAGSAFPATAAPAAETSSAIPNPVYVDPDFDPSGGVFATYDDGHQSPVKVTEHGGQITSVTPLTATAPKVAAAAPAAAAAGCGQTTAVAPAYNKWYTSVGGCAILGADLTAVHHYSWVDAQGNSSDTCVQGKGYAPQGNQSGYTMVVFWKSIGGCGTSGNATLEWGPVAAMTQVKLESITPARGTTIWFT
jgi:hypothetical protein